MGSSPLGGQAPSHSHMGPSQVESHRLYFSKLLLASDIFSTFSVNASFVEGRVHNLLFPVFSVHKLQCQK